MYKNPTSAEGATLQPPTRQADLSLRANGRITSQNQD